MNKAQAYKKAYREKNKRVEFSLSESEYKQFKKIAYDLGYGNKVGRLAKQFCLAYKENHFKDNSLIDDIRKRLIYLLRSVANNVNQMAQYSPELTHAIEQYNLLGTVKISEDNLIYTIRLSFKKGNSKQLLLALESLFKQIKIQTDAINTMAHESNINKQLSELNTLFERIKTINDLIVHLTHKKDSWL